MKLGMEVGLGPGHIVLNGDPAPPKGAQSAQFSAHVHCDQTAGWINMPLDMEVGLGPGDFVLDGNPVPPKKRGYSPQKGARPQFWAHACCGQTIAHLSYCWSLVCFNMWAQVPEYVNDLLVPV